MNWEVDDQSIDVLVVFKGNEVTWHGIGNLESAISLRNGGNCENLRAKVRGELVVGAWGDESASYVDNTSAVFSVHNPAVGRGGA